MEDIGYVHVGIHDISLAGYLPVAKIPVAPVCSWVLESPLRNNIRLPASEPRVTLLYTVTKYPLLIINEGDGPGLKKILLVRLRINYTAWSLYNLDPLRYRMSTVLTLWHLDVSFR